MINKNQKIKNEKTLSTISYYDEDIFDINLSVKIY